MGIWARLQQENPIPCFQKKLPTNGIHVGNHPSSTSLSTASVLHGDETPTSSTSQDHDTSQSIINRMKFDLDEKSTQERLEKQIIFDPKTAATTLFQLFSPDVLTQMPCDDKYGMIEDVSTIQCVRAYGSPGIKDQIVLFVYVYPQSKDKIYAFMTAYHQLVNQHNIEGQGWLGTFIVKFDSEDHPKQHVFKDLSTLIKHQPPLTGAEIIWQNKGKKTRIILYFTLPQ